LKESCKSKNPENPDSDKRKWSESGFARLDNFQEGAERILQIQKSRKS